MKRRQIRGGGSDKGDVRKCALSQQGGNGGEMIPSLAEPRLKDNEFNHGRAIRRCFVQGRTMDSGDSSGNQVDSASGFIQHSEIL